MLIRQNTSNEMDHCATRSFCHIEFHISSMPLSRVRRSADQRKMEFNVSEGEWVSMEQRGKGRKEMGKR